MGDHNEARQSLRSHFPKSIIKYLVEGNQKNFGFNGVAFQTAINSSTLDSSRAWFGKFGPVSEIEGNTESNEHIIETKKIFETATQIGWSESKFGAALKEKLKRIEDSHSLALFSPSTH